MKPLEGKRIKSAEWDFNQLGCCLGLVYVEPHGPCGLGDEFYPRVFGTLTSQYGFGAPEKVTRKVVSVALSPECYSRVALWCAGLRYT